MVCACSCFLERKSNICSNIDTRKFNYCLQSKIEKGKAVWLPSHNLPSQMNSHCGAYKTVRIYFLLCGLNYIINFLYAPTTNLRIDFWKENLENMPTFLKKKEREREKKV